MLRLHLTLLCGLLASTVMQSTDARTSLTDIDAKLDELLLRSQAFDQNQIVRLQTNISDDPPGDPCASGTPFALDSFSGPFTVPEDKMLLITDIAYDVLPMQSVPPGTVLHFVLRHRADFGDGGFPFSYRSEPTVQDGVRQFASAQHAFTTPFVIGPGLSPCTFVTAGGQNARTLTTLNGLLVPLQNRADQSR